MSPFQKKIEKALDAFRSTDETRISLLGVYMCSKERDFCSTDGHRAIFVPEDLVPQVYLSARELATDRVFLKETGESFSDFPINALRKFLSRKKDFSTRVALTVPDCFSSSRKRPLTKVFVSEDGLSFYMPSKPYVCIDAFLLRPLAGLDVIIYFKGATDAVLFELDQNVAAVIMPFRTEGGAK